jgi:predicted nuclease of predicted toxin-antitoxin system
MTFHGCIMSHKKRSATWGVTHMSWRVIPPVTKEEYSSFIREKKLKLYADEDIEEWVVELLRMRGVNIQSARELGHRGKPDDFQAECARKNRRVILTKNGKDFLGDGKLPFNKTYGVIAIDCDTNKENEYITVLARIVDIFVTFGDTWQGQKIRVTPSEVTTRSVDGGHIVTKRFKVEGRRIFIWEE